MAEQLIGQDLYLKVANAKGESRIDHHRVWDANKFISERQAMGCSSENPKEWEIVTISSRQEYLNSISRNKK